MIYQVSEQEAHKAKIPHEIFLTNLIANHILWFFASLGMVGSFWQPLAMVPVISFLLLGYILWKARRVRLAVGNRVEGWYMMCHWQIAARRSRVFLGMLSMLGVVATLGWVGFTYFGMMKELVMAMIGGLGILPVMITVLVLVIMESDVMNQTTQRRMPRAILRHFPNPGVEVVDDPQHQVQPQPQAAD